MQKQDENKKHFLSTEGWYFRYRYRKNRPNILEAFLYKVFDDMIYDSAIVSVWPEEGITKEKSHDDVINFFEARLLLKSLNKQP